MTNARLYPLDPKVRRFSGHEPRRSVMAGVESLTSFLCRLALEHCCAPHGLYGALAAKNWEGERISLTKIRSAESQLIISLGHVARNAASALEDQSDIPHAAEMTFLFLSDLCDKKAKHFLHKIRHWCSHCYLDARRGKIPAWDPLYWAPSTTTICVVHGTLLRKACSHCKKSQRYLPKFPFLDFCEYCGSDLADAHDPGRNPPQFEERTWLASAEIDLIGTQQTTPLSRENFSSRLNEALKTSDTGTAESLSKITGIQACNLRNWKLKASAPTWSNFMDVSYRLNVPPSQLGGPDAVFLTPAAFNCNSTLLLDKQHRRLPRKKLDEARVAILELLEFPIDVWTLRRASIFGVLKQFDICYQTFQRNFPDLAEAFSKKRAEAADYRKQMLTNARLERVRNAREKLSDMSLTPSARNLKKSGLVKISDVVPSRKRQQSAANKIEGKI